jgi:Divergent InlB B-repeat domain
VTLGDSQEVIATFELERAVDFTLTTSTSGSGSISATSGSDDVGRECTAGCAYPQGTVVTLSATPGPRENTVEWTGCVRGDPATCDVTMSQDRRVSARFSSVVD